MVFKKNSVKILDNTYYNASATISLTDKNLFLFGLLVHKTLILVFTFLVEQEAKVNLQRSLFWMNVTRTTLFWRMNKTTSFKPLYYQYVF